MTFYAIQTSEISGSVLEWMGRHPHQCVLLAVEILWAMKFRRCLEEDGVSLAAHRCVCVCVCVCLAPVLPNVYTSHSTRVEQ